MSCFSFLLPDLPACQAVPTPAAAPPHPAARTSVPTEGGALIGHMHMKGSPRCIYISSNMAACRSLHGQQEGVEKGKKERGEGKELSRRLCCPMLFCSDQNVRQRFWSCTEGYMWSGALALALDLHLHLDSHYCCSCLLA